MNQAPLLSFSTACSIILEAVPTIDSESVSLDDLLGRVLAGDVVAPSDVPPFSNSSMDGYALRSTDTDSASSERPVELNVAGEVAAGKVLESTVQAGSAVRIFTGGRIPDGADAVLEQERVETVGGKIRILQPVTRGKNIRLRGEDIGRGAIVMRRGNQISPGRLGVLASLDVQRASVFRVPRVGVLTTGDELAGAGEPLEDGKIHNSNAYTLGALVRENGCGLVDLGTSKDVPGELEKKIRAGLLCDALVTSGGVSVGDRDLVLRTLRETGVEILFWKVNMKPGMPFAFGMFKDPERNRIVPVFALPGNPVSSVVTFLQLAKPGLGKLRGFAEDRPSLTFMAKMEADFRKSDGKRHFVRGIVRNEKGELLVRTSGTQSSGVLSSIAVSNCFIVVPEETTIVRAGEFIEIELLR